MTISIGNVVPIIILFQSIVFAFVLVSDKGPKRISNYYLAFFMTILGLQFVAITLENLQLEPGFVAYGYCIYGFVYGPALFFYTRSLVYRSFQFRLKDVFHLIPALSIVFLIILGLNPCQPYGFLLYVSLVSYIVAAIRELIAYRKVVLETQSTSAKTDLKWLQWTIILFIVVLLLDIADQFLWPMELWDSFSVIHLGILLLVNWMFYKGLRQPQIFLGITESEAELVRAKSTGPSQLPTTAELADLDRIKQFMQTSEIYRNAELTLTELAQTLEVSPRYLSYLINRCEQKNFASFVNGYRIAMAKNLLAHDTDPNATILEIMYAVGFNSKSSFNTLFKQQTGYTPSEYRKKGAD